MTLLGNITMANAKRTRQVDRHTAFACLSVPADRITEKHRDEIIAAFKRKGWGVLVEERRCRFIHFDARVAADASRVLDDLDCDKTGWSAYRLSFPTVEAAKAVVESAEWR